MCVYVLLMRVCVVNYIRSEILYHIRLLGLTLSLPLTNSTLVLIARKALANQMVLRKRAVPFFYLIRYIFMLVKELW